jgi:phosphatidylethanolamine/phosphatidyl-N-methylethanolamine N-methyltransferase
MLADYEAGMTVHDNRAFLRAWLAAPLRVASIVPSGPALSRLITSEISPASGHVVELGAGTGVFTRALLQRGVDETDLTLVEFDWDLAARLRQKFPQARVLRMDAAALGQAGLLTLSPVGAVVSGLPLLSMPDVKVKAILSGGFDLLGEGGAFYQFTYGPICPVRKPVLEALGLKAARIGGVLKNLPPAAVYRISRAALT